MTASGKRMKGFFCGLLCLLMVVASLPAGIFASAESAYDYNRVVDPSTADDWKTFFSTDVPDTENAGAVWSDKSVFTDADEFGGLVEMESEEENFLVALSAMASDKNITGYAYTPTDTMLVLDVSRSMGKNTMEGDRNNNAVAELVKAANKTIGELLSVNKHNRVGVVLYSGTYSTDVPSCDGDALVLLPLGRYSCEDGDFLVKRERTVGAVGAQIAGESVAVNAGVQSESGKDTQLLEKEVYGGTFIQGGITKAMKEFLAVEDTEIPGSEFQSGTGRRPVFVLMSDGVPATATNEYMGGIRDGEFTIGESTMGDGSLPEGELETAIPFVTQLTASYAKARVSEHYGSDALFYTLGYNVEGSAVLDPDNTTDTDAHWHTYNITAEGGTMQLAVDRVWISTGFYGSGHWDTVFTSVPKSSYKLTEDYCDGYYYTKNNLTDAFDSITREIVNRSVYYPTLVEGDNTDHDGYLEFIDDIGLFMEVKKIHGIRLGDVIFRGDNIAANFTESGSGTLGTIERPNHLGDELIRSVKARLGITNTADAQKLVDKAYRAGQLSFSEETGEYSNYIGWYSDAQGKYIAHGTDNDTSYPEGAVFYNRSYGYLGEVTDGYKSSDMMYVSVRVREDLESGTSAVLFRIPASLIPVITYNVTLTGDSLDNPGDVTLTLDDTVGVDTTGDGVYDTEKKIAPICLVYEVGLNASVNELTVADMVGEDYRYAEDNRYTFYASRWNVGDLNHERPSLAENTVAYYEPSVNNERYYYNENTTVYVKDKEEYIPYVGAASPVEVSGDYYRQYAVYETINDRETANARIHLHYEQMSDAALGVACAETVGDDTQWYVPKGTIHRTLGHFHAGKGGFTDESRTDVNSNYTGTLKYSHYMQVETISDAGGTAGCYADVILGNNGAVTIEAAQGIRISQSRDATLKGRNEVFTYIITQLDEAKDEPFRLVRVGADGKLSEEELTFFGGSVSLDVMTDEVIYLLDLPEGRRYRVTEFTDNREYKVISINDKKADSFIAEIDKGAIAKADFLNTLKTSEGCGAIVVSTYVHHPFGEDYVIPDTVGFRFELSFEGEGDNLPESREVRASAGEILMIKDIPTGTSVTLTPVEHPDGFECHDDPVTVYIEEEENYFLDFEHFYIPCAAKADISLTGAKRFSGRAGDEWLDTDSFTVKLQKLSGAQWEDMTFVDSDGRVRTAQAVIDKNTKRYDFSDFLMSESFDTAGVYSYRVQEVFSENPYKGITYDKGVRWFDVFVADADMDGSLEITDIQGLGGSVVDKYGDAWVLDASFANTYSPKGSDAVSVIVKKLVSDKSLSRADYEFGLYQNNRLVTVLPETSEAGETLVTLSYGAADIGKHIHYVLREMIPDNVPDGREYTSQEYNIVVKVEDDNEGAVRALLQVTENAPDAETLSGEQIEVTFGKEQETEVPTEPEEKPTVSDPATDPTSGTEATQPSADADIPDTGETSGAAVAMVVVLLCTAGLFVGYYRRKRQTP